MGMMKEKFIEYLEAKDALEPTEETVQLEMKFIDEDEDSVTFRLESVDENLT
jgi:3-hydroxy-3-methylglutaryl CoA synthase